MLYYCDSLEMGPSHRWLHLGLNELPKSYKDYIFSRIVFLISSVLNQFNLLLVLEQFVWYEYRGHWEDPYRAINLLMYVSELFSFSPGPQCLLANILPHEAQL